VIEILPAARRQLVKDFLSLLVPTPPEVPGESVESSGEFGQFSRMDRIHG
jgi:hypothetical protein